MERCGENFKRIYPLVMPEEASEEMVDLQAEYEDLRRFAHNYETEVKKLKEQKKE